MTAESPFRASPLGPEAARKLDELIGLLSVDEALWTSGYLAGFAARVGQAAGSAPSRPEAVATEPLVILYGSQTGHSADLARHIERRAIGRGLAARAIDMAAYPLQEVKTLRHLLLVVSTYGEGEPPDSARGFHEFLMGRRAPRLSGAEFAVLGLGDSSFRHFCKTAREFDARLEELGAHRLMPRLDCDVDYEDPADVWIEATLAAIAPHLTKVPVVSVAASSPSSSGYDEANPFPASVLDTIPLTGRGSDKVVRHIELSLEGSGLAYQPGDALGVQSRNDPALVTELIESLRLDRDTIISDGGRQEKLAAILESSREITLATSRFVELYGEAAKSRKLKTLTRPDKRDELDAYLKDRQIADIVRESPAKGIEPHAFVAMLRKLRPRLYSLASSPLVFPDEAHLTVGLVAFGPPERPRRGVTSGWLAERLGPEDTVPVFVAANEHFRLPTDSSRPILMIGAGTGVAPFRAFMQQREATGANGRNWLFFGDRRFRTDFLYQTEWQRLVKTGLLSRMDVAFSRDQAEKVYVQHRLLEQGRDVFAWIEDGGHVYVCGDASTLAPAVEAALIRIVSDHGGFGSEQAADYLKRLQREGRYQRDVY
ncbi:assimilatory sulfite reductase (NADPH) flavoprotein subunit [Magnetospirillum molischianum]|uniref:Sulfite reductase [NADPH] flavoprotein alpha-component n=1 Tax=Magnetospirillum molischianum DSM 120 TaxID=1150626 RepID=H8FV31_MAGML|nr:assimilatory sulfite reductase (NADPH) flavoprotein subunit [Magnetospirillum molischianum]CCG42219.1 Sulfite reductase (NADPH) flavoprotein alpha-component [Magnetospirillum molischianum DSM 120]